jgi:hypothetical protein
MQERKALEECRNRLVRNDDPTLVEVTVPIFQPHYLASFSKYLPQSKYVTSLWFDVTTKGNNTQCELDHIIK